MYSKPPSLVLGFHGCEKSTINSVINGRLELHPSVNDYDWLGSGIYFWEQNYARAYQWAQESCKRRGSGESAVIGAVIDLGYCLNLTDARYIDLLRREYGFLKSDLEMMGLEMPHNAGKTEDKLLRRLDCAVVEHLHARMKLEQAKHIESSSISVAPFDSARGLFSEGDVIYPGAGFKAKTHVQICVRNPNCIKGYFVPREANSEWRIP